MQVASRAPAAPSKTPSAHSWVDLVPASLRRYGEYALGGATALAMLASILLTFLVAPTADFANGFDVQRIEYFHVGIAWIAYLAFFVVCVASGLYLWRRDERWDWLARASVEIGTVFTTLVLISGSLWGKAVWGVWWDWEPRLTTTLVLWFIYVGYLLLRSYTGRSESGARNAAVLGIVGFIAVPINYVSITWWQDKFQVHPAIRYSFGKTTHDPPAVVIALLVSVLAFTLLYAYLLLHAYRLQQLQTKVERLRIRAELD